MNNPYRRSLPLDTALQVKVEKYVAEAIKLMAEQSKISENEMANIALRRYIATHGDMFPKGKMPKDPAGTPLN